MKIEKFLVPKLLGERFEGNSIPLEFLKDLAALEELIVEMAKWTYLESNKDRTRVPRGFAESISLRLASIESGSAIPRIDLEIKSNNMFPESMEFCEQARDRVLSGIKAAEKDEDISEHLPEHVFFYFNRVGRSLKRSESIEFSPSDSDPFKLTPETRKKIVMAAKNFREYSEETSVRGLVPEADQDKMTFDIQTVDGRRIKVTWHEQHLETIKKAWNEYNSQTRVLLQGPGKFSRYGKLMSFETIEHVSILDPLDAPARLEELKLLEDGWLEGRGLAPDSQGLDWLADEFELHYPDRLPLPYLYPTEEGGIQAEWTWGESDISIEIDLASRSAAWHCLNLSSGEDESLIIDLSSDKGWDELIEKLDSLWAKTA